MKQFIFSTVLMVAAVSMFSVPFFVHADAGGVNSGVPAPGYGGSRVETSPDSGSTVGRTGNGRIPNPLGSNVNSLFDLVKVLLTKIVLPIGVVVIVFMVIYTGYKFVMAKGNMTKVTEARRMLLYVLIGSAILLGSIVIAEAIKTTVCKIAPSVSDCTSSLPSFSN